MATFDDAVRITATGTTVTTGAATANTAIPNTAAGTPPRYIRVAATTESYVKVGDNSVTATTNDILVQPADSIVLTVQGCTKLAYIQGTSSGKVSITPLEDQ